MSNPRDTSLSQHLSTLPKLDKTHFVSMFVRDQRVHAKSHVLEGRAVVSHWDHASVVVPNEHKVQALESDLDAFGTPVLKPRVLARIIPEAARVPLQDYKNDLGHPESLRDGRLTHHTKKENKRKRTGSTIATKRSVPKSKRPEPPPKEPVSSIDVKDEQASRHRERRDRKRAKRAIINPRRSSDVENETMSNAEAPRNAKNNARAKIPAGFALMHGFTATNVGRSRLTIKPSASIGVFNKGKASVKTLTKHKCVKKGRQSTGFSELGFLNNGDQRRRKFLENSISIDSSESDSHSRSSDQSPEQQPRKFVITNRRPPKSRRAEAAKTPHCNSHGISGDSVMSVDRLSISRSRQGRSSTGLLPKATPAGSTMWDIEIETASMLSSAPPFEKRSVMLEIRNRRWNDSPANDLAGPDWLAASPRSKMSAEKLDNLVEAKSPSQSLGPSQSASQLGRCFPRADDILPLAGGCSKYFISEVTQKEQKAILEKQSVIPAVKVSISPSKGAEEIRPSYPDIITTWERASEPEPDPLDQRPSTSSPIKSLDKEVAQHGLVPQHDLDFGIALCLQPSPTEWPAFSSLHPVLSGVEPGNLGLDSRFDSGLAHAAGWDLEHSVEYFARDGYLWPSIDYTDDPRHHGRDTPEDLVPCPSYGGYNANMLYLYPAGSGGSQEPDCIPEHDLSEAAGEYMINPLLSFSDNGERGLVDEHIVGWNMCPDSNEDPQFGEEYVGNELELDDGWNQCYSDILDGSTSSSDLCNSCSGDFEPVCSAAMFSQGRALLMGSTPRDGITTTGTAVQIRSRPPLSLVEADVAKTLRNHWLPQKL